MNLIQNIKALFTSKPKDEIALFVVKIAGFTPSNHSLYKTAFQHKSSHDRDNYERLEFLGDSILDAVASTVLYHKFPEKDEGELSKIRGELVSRKVLNRIADDLALSRVCNYDNNLDFKHFKNLGGNILEALIGAIYLDKGYKTATNFIVNTLLKNHIDWQEVTQIHDYKSVLYAKSQKEDMCIEFDVVRENVHDFDNRFEIALSIDGAEVSRAFGSSKKKAEQKAAKAYLISKNELIEKKS